MTIWTGANGIAGQWVFESPTVEDHSSSPKWREITISYKSHQAEIKIAWLVFIIDAQTHLNLG